jgi:long-chain acyl-CoA synthetase
MINKILSNLKNNRSNFIKNKHSKILYNEIYETIENNNLNDLLDNVKKRDIVVLNIENHFLFIALFLKLWKMGVVILPASNWKYDVLLKIMKDYKISYILSDKSMKDDFYIDKILINDSIIKLHKISINNYDLPLNENDFLLMFTSGTTSVPKLVRVSYANIEHNIKEIQKSLMLSNTDYGFIMLPIEHGYTLVGQILVSLFSSSNIYLFYNTTINNYTNIVNKEKITIFWTVATYARMIVRFKGECPTVRVFSTAGAKFPFDDYDTLKLIFTKANMMNNYGGTEASPRLSWIYDTDINFMNKSVGKPIENTEVKIIKNRVAYRGKGIMIGYFNQKPLLDDFFITNDLGYIDKEGYLFITGRFDEQINLGGKKINLMALRDFISKQKDIKSFECKYDTKGEGKIIININSEMDIKNTLSTLISSTFNISNSFFNINLDTNLIEYQRVVKN